MTYRRFQPDDAATIASWVRTPAELSLLDPVAKFPLTAEQVVSWAAHRTRAIVFSGVTGVSGYCELQASRAERGKNVWVCREIVQPEYRGWGYGRAWAGIAMRIAETELGADVISAWIAPQNARSIAVAQRLGLRIVRTDRVRGRYFLRLEKVCNENEA
jgi:RimJ/RimL family protein N-acetyltransferase